MGNNVRGKCAGQGSDYPAVHTASDPPPEMYHEEKGLWIVAAEVPTRDESTKEQSFWLFGRIDEAVALVVASELFSGFGDATSEGSKRSTFEIEEGPVQGMGLWNHITGVLTVFIGLVEAFLDVPSEKAIKSEA